MFGTVYLSDLPAALKDAGCDAETAQAILELDGRGETPEALSLLRMQRRRLLADMHRAQEAIDCLDYIMGALSRRLKEKE